MKGKHSDAIYIAHILECIQRIEENVSIGREAFMMSHVLQDATIRNLQTMAESTQRLSDPLKAAHPEVGWKELAGFRNVLVHNYLGVNLKRIWEVIDSDLPVLKQAVEDLARQAPGSASENEPSP